jgi:hypothetical protein
MLRETGGWEIPYGMAYLTLSRIKQSLEEKNMEPTISVVTAMLYGAAYNKVEYGEPIVPEADFVPFDLSHLRDFRGESEHARNSFGGHVQNAPDALPA